jgi:acyl carrier protein
MGVQEKVREFVEQNFYVAESDQLSDESSLIRSGVVDSTGVLEIIAFVETEFGISVEDRDAVPANLDSIARIAAFVARKVAEAGAREVA